MNQTNNIFISNLPNGVTEYSILKLLSQFGKITNFNFPVHKVGKLRGRTVGYCFVSYTNQCDAYLAIKKINKLKYSNSILHAKFAKPKLFEEVEFKYEYDEKIISQELENIEGIIDHETLSQILEKSKKMQAEKNYLDNKKSDMNKTKKLINTVKSLKDKQAQIKQIEEALKKYQF